MDTASLEVDVRLGTVFVLFFNHKGKNYCVALFLRGKCLSTLFGLAGGLVEWVSLLQ